MEVHHCPSTVQGPEHSGSHPVSRQRFKAVAEWAGVIYTFGLYIGAAVHALGLQDRDVRFQGLDPGPPQ